LVTGSKSVMKYVPRNKRELEEKMTRLERAIETFSKAKVYVKF
jgi:hypothetical protein